MTDQHVFLEKYGPKIDVAKYGAQAALDYLTAPQLEKRSYPETTKVGKRLSAMTTLWRKLAGLPLKDVIETKAYRAGILVWDLLSFYDDLIDESTSEKILTSGQLKTSNKTRNGKVPSEYVSNIVKAIGESNLGREKNIALLGQINRFRRNQYEMYRKYHDGINLNAVDFDTTHQYRIDTSIPVMRIWAHTMNRMASIPDEKGGHIMDLVATFGMIGQFVDDFRDWPEDEGQTYNLLSGALHENPQEMTSLQTSLNNHTRYDRTLITSLAPNSLNKFTQTYDTYVLKLHSLTSGNEKILDNLESSGYGF